MYTKMIMKVKLLSVAIAVAGLSICSCSDRSAHNDNTISFSELSESRTYRLDNSAKAYGTDKDIIIFDSVSLLVPSKIANQDLKALQDSIFKTAFDTTGVDHHALVEKYFANTVSDSGFKCTKIDKDSITVTIADGFDIVEGKVINLTPKLLVYCVTNSRYLPHAANGMTIKEYINYRNDTGRIITLRDLFSPAGIGNLPALIAKRASDLSALFGPTEVTALPVGDNYYISPSGEIVFAYQPYEIASHAQGIINVPFYPYELIDCLTAEGIELFDLQDFND